MMPVLFNRLARLLFAVPCIALVACSLTSQAVTLPNPAVDTASTHDGTQTTVLAGGCFWGMQEVFKHVKGIKHVTSGYAGGAATTANYESVSSGATGHAEAVQIEYDPAQVTYGQILKVYFAVAHNPTELNRQGPDRGTQYRSAIFFTTAEQQRVAQSYITQIQGAKAFSSPIVTQVVPLKAFYVAEAYHQDYAMRHPYEPYIVINDLPKVANLQKQFPDLYVGK